jgi:hypothetical protein
MLEVLIDNVFAMLGGRVFQQTVGIPMGTNCAPLHFKLNGIDAINKITKPRIIQ